MVESKNKLIEIDRHVGSRLREMRVLRGLSQEAVAAVIGKTFQQVQKYETGANRISASILFKLAELLNVGVEEFFSGLLGRAPSAVALRAQRETLEFVRSFERLPEASRDTIRTIAKTLAAA